MIPEGAEGSGGGEYIECKSFFRGSNWTEDGAGDGGSQKPMGAIEHVTFHHSGDGRPFTAVDVTAIAKHIEGVRQYHRQRGMIDIGYRTMRLMPRERVWELRPYSIEGQHTPGLTTNGTRHGMPTTWGSAFWAITTNRIRRRPRKPAWKLLRGSR